MLKNEKQLSK